MATPLEILTENIGIARAQGMSEEDIVGMIRNFGYTPERYRRALKRLGESGGKIVEAGAGKFLGQGASLGYGDEIEARARSLVGPESYDQELAAIRLGMDEYREDHGGRAIAAEMAGAVLPSVLISRAGGGPAAAIPFTRIANVGRNMRIGAIEGGIAGSGASEDDLLSAGTAKSAALGAGLGSAIPLSLGAAGAGIDAAKPIFNPAQQEIVGNLLKKTATNPQQAVANLRGNSNTLVPGSVPTTAQAARDPGLAALETPIRGMDSSNRIGNRMIEQQIARSEEMGKLAGSKDDLARLKARRDEITGPLRESAFDEGGMVTNPGVLIDAIDQLANRPGIKGRRSVREIILRFKKDIEDLAVDPDNAGGYSPGNLHPIDPRDLYGARQEIGDLMSGRMGGDDSAKARLARKELMLVMGLLDDTIEDVSPGFKNYLKTYSQKSGPVNRMETMQEIQLKSASGSNLQTDLPVITQTKLANILRNKAKEIARLPESNRKRINAIMRDLNRANAATAPGVKVPGSDTVKNMSIASVIGNLFGEASTGNVVPNALMRPFKVLYGIFDSDEKMTEMLVQAMLDPELSARLLSRATEQNVDNLVTAVKRKIPGIIYGDISATVGLHQD